MRGLGRQMPVTMFAFLLGSLSIIGLPPFAGAWSKWFLLEGAFASGQTLVAVVLAVSSLLNIAYLLPIVVNAFFLAPESNKEHSGIHEAPWLCVVPLSVTAVACLVLFLHPEPFFELARLVAVAAGGPLMSNAPHEPASEKRHVWDDPANVKKLLWVFWTVCAIAFAVDFCGASPLELRARKNSGDPFRGACRAARRGP